MSILFFAMNCEAAPHVGALPPGYHAELWRPTLRVARPAGMEGRAPLAWWALHHLHVFANRDYAQLVIRDAAGMLVHRAGVFPRWPRFPFMRASDLQVGDTWTHPAHRGRRLAAVAIREVAVRMAAPARTLWYLTDASNVHSIRAAERAGMRLRGVGTRQPRLGLHLLGAFRLAEGAGEGAVTRTSHPAH